RKLISVMAITSRGRRHPYHRLGAAVPRRPAAGRGSSPAEDAAMAPFQDEMTTAPIAPREQLRVFRAKDPYIALGLAVSHLLTKPSFACPGSGDWSRILTGQINRKHYYFAVDSRNQIQGFMGWAVTSKQKAEAWVEGRGAVAFADIRDGH